MKLDFLGNLPRLAHHKILEDEHVGEDRVVNVLPAFRRIMILHRRI